MLDENDLDREIIELQTAPTILGWEIEINRVLHGQRDSELFRLGGVEEYIEVILAESSDIAISEVYFHTALRSIAQVWQPSRFDDNAYLMYMLDLLGTYTPSAGFVKILSYMQTWGRFETNINVEGYEAPQDLHMKALAVLEQYFGAAPAVGDNDAPSFKGYLDILRAHLWDPHYAGYALGRLIDLKIIESGHEEVAQIIYQNPSSLQLLLSILLNRYQRSQSENDLAHVYEHCLELGEASVEQFKVALQELGASFEHVESGPAIRLQDGKIIKLPLQPRIEEKYYFQRIQDTEDLVLAMQVGTTVLHSYSSN